MSRRVASSLALVVLIAVTSVACMAQLPPVPVPPDAGVRGSGAVDLPDTMGIFDLTALRWDNTPSGTLVYGWVRFCEVDARGVRLNSVEAKVIKSVEVSGNTAVVTAAGYWNGMPSAITVVALDDLAGDNLHIIAKPLNALTVIYERQGGVMKGDIVVFSKPLIVSFARGCGAIAVTNMTIGRFDFYAKSSPAGTGGSICYVEFNPRSLSPMPVTRIFVPMVSVLKVEGNKAMLEGLGTLNGARAKVKVMVADNVRPDRITPIPARDVFGIEAVTLDGIRTYRAGGPLIGGDIVVGTISL